MSPRLFLVLIVVAVTLSGCGWKGSGTVVERDYDRPYMSTTRDCTTRTMGTGTRKRTTQTCRNRPVYHPASWSLLVRDEKDRSEHWVNVSQLEYMTHPVGSKFKNGN
jgi:hypothetical protein